MAENDQQPKKQKKKKNKPQRLKARQPRGFVDRAAGDIRATDQMMSKIREVYELYGFDPVETPMFEYTDALGKFLPDTDRSHVGDAPSGGGPCQAAALARGVRDSRLGSHFG